MALDNINEFVGALTSTRSDVGQMPRLRAMIPDEGPGHIGTLYCPSCSEYSGMKLNTIHFHKTVGQQLYQEIMREDSAGFTRPQLPEYSDPSLFRLDCVNCENAFYTLLYNAENGPAVVLFSVYGGGIATPNTPDLVKYYLEQSYRAQASSAYSAALTMYRAALEQLLENKGFEGKLSAKLKKLTEDISNNIAPNWAKRLDTTILSVLQEICDSHAHANELHKLQALNTPFMTKVQKTFSNLLSIAYEQEPRKAAIKEKLAAALKKASKKRTNATTDATS